MSDKITVVASDVNIAAGSIKIVDRRPASDNPLRTVAGTECLDFYIDGQRIPGVQSFKIIGEPGAWVKFELTVLSLPEIKAPIDPEDEKALAIFEGKE